MKRDLSHEVRPATFVEATHDLTCEHDLDGNILFVNRAAADALEIPLEQLGGTNIRSLLAREAHPKIEQYLETIRCDGVATGMMTVCTASDRKRVWEYQNAIVADASGNRIVRGLARDVTDREEALRALRESERQLRGIIENASDIIAIVDSSGCLQFHSPSTERLLGYEPEDLTGRSLVEFVHEEDEARANEFFEEQARPDASTRTIDFRVHHSDGSWRWFSVVARPFLPSGHAPSIIINARDITDRILLEAQLAQANRLNSLGKLAATVAHEFNNVLMGIQPFADLMQRPGIAPESIAKGARHIANSIVRGKRVALDILRFTNPAKPSFEPVNVGDWWRQLVPQMQARLRDNIEMQLSFAENLTILADAAQLSQVFANLVSNARDAMPAGGTLRISAARGRAGATFPFGVVPNPEQFIHFRVADTGTGMPARVLLHAFDPLFTTKQNGGTGLGLAVAHQVVRSHGGQIFAESTAGSGSTFHIFIPSTEPAAGSLQSHALRTSMASRSSDAYATSART